MAAPLLEAIQLTKSYTSKGSSNRIEVLRDVHFQIVEGESVAIMGPSGSGKSTLLHLLGGLDRPDGGQVLFRGERIDQFSNDRLAQWRNAQIGFVFQFHYLLPEFTALENVCMPALIHGKTDDYLDRARSLLTRVGLSDREGHRPSELSGGEQQRVAVARALMNKPALLLADEPTGNLDETNTANLMQLLDDLSASEGLTMILVTHDPVLAARCRRQITLQKNIPS